MDFHFNIHMESALAKANGELHAKVLYLQPLRMAAWQNIHFSTCRVHAVFIDLDVTELHPDVTKTMCIDESLLSVIDTKRRSVYFNHDTYDSQVCHNRLH